MGWIQKGKPFEGVEVWKNRGAHPTATVPDIPEVYEYMVFRAEIEGVAMTLEPKYFKYNLAQGVRSFFGIKTDRLGEVMFDDKNPAAWKEYRNKRP